MCIRDSYSANCYVPEVACTGSRYRGSRNQKLQHLMWPRTSYVRNSDVCLHFLSTSCSMATKSKRYVNVFYRKYTYGGSETGNELSTDIVFMVKISTSCIEFYITKNVISTTLRIFSRSWRSVASMNNPH